jgi:hypothetical protein
VSLQTALVAIKTANSALNTLVGTRFHPDGLPQNIAMPAVCFREISRIRQEGMGYVVANRRPRVQMDGYVKSTRSGGTTSVETMRDALIAAFYGYSGTIGGETIKAIRIDNEIRNPAGFEMVDQNTEADRIMIDFIVDMS